MAQFRFIGDPRANGHGPSPQELFGLIFSRDEWTDVPADLVEKAASHSHLEPRPEKVRRLDSETTPLRREGVKGAEILTADAAGFPSEPDPVFERGAAAKAAGKKRIVPPAYRGKPEETRWLAGYDGVSDENAN